jgi:uncharacterized protein (DUF1501 family)
LDEAVTMPGLTRRSFLGSMAAVAAALLPGPPALALSGPPRLVLIRLRGGMDGLAAVVPFGDPDLGEARRGLAMPDPHGRVGIVDLDGFFGLHPSFTTLAALYGRREAIILPAATTGYRGRAHREGQHHLDRLIESEIEASNAAVSDNVESAADLASDLAERHPFLAARMLGVGAERDLRPAVKARLDESGRRRRAVLRSAAMETGRRIADGAPGPFLLDSHGWDSHAAQTGRFAAAAASLDEAIGAIALEAGRSWRNTVVLIATEFGRSVAMNEAGGTDHGMASAAFIAGGAVAGGRVLGAWPGLTPGGDLAPSADLRTVLRSLARDHLGRDPSGVVATQWDLPTLIRA